MLLRRWLQLRMEQRDAEPGSAASGGGGGDAGGGAAAAAAAAGPGAINHNIDR